MPDFEGSSFDPVLLDLRDINDYMVLVAAMNDYAGQLEHEADGDEADARHYGNEPDACLLYTSPSPRDATLSRMPSSA